MKLFVDTASLDEVKRASEWGLVDGVTTNPSLIARENVPYRKRVLEICDVVGPGKAVSAECIEPEFDKMLAEARDIAKWHPNIHVKVPLTPAGVEVMARLSPQGVRFNCTLIFSLPQALLAAKAGAKFLSIFVGRVDDMGSGEAFKTVEDAVDMVNTYEFPNQPEVLVASVRSPLQIVEAVRVGAQITTAPFKILEELFHHPLTDAGIERFAKDYQEALAHAARNA
ncbi:MAG: transaldolase family protein [Capsulimonadaceae bacterium]|nr:transaldolase family protein [Capsulimonadaceae bacterium]